MLLLNMLVNVKSLKIIISILNKVRNFIYIEIYMKLKIKEKRKSTLNKFQGYDKPGTRI